MMNYNPASARVSGKRPAPSVISTPNDDTGLTRTDMDTLKQSIAARERTILQDISNMSAKKTQLAQLAPNQYASSTTAKSASQPVDLESVDDKVKAEVGEALDYMEKPPTHLVDCFGVPEVRVSSRDIARAKGALWVKRWSKDPLARNNLPDHFLP